MRWKQVIDCGRKKPTLTEFRGGLFDPILFYTDTHTDTTQYHYKR